MCKRRAFPHQRLLFFCWVMTANPGFVSGCSFPRTQQNSVQTCCSFISAIKELHVAHHAQQKTSFEKQRRELWLQNLTALTQKISILWHLLADNSSRRDGFGSSGICLPIIMKLYFHKFQHMVFTMCEFYSFYFILRDT